MSTAAPEPPETAVTVDTDFSYSMERGNLIAVPILVAFLIVVAVPYELIWGGAGFVTGLLETPLWLAIVVLLGGAAVHEGLHLLGFLAFGGVDSSSIRLGIHWKTLTPFASCDAPLTARAYRWSAALPGLLLGLVPSLGGLAAGIDWMAAWGAVFLAVAAGDALVLWRTRGLSGDTMVQDHPDRIGCRLAPGS